MSTAGAGCGGVAISALDEPSADGEPCVVDEACVVDGTCVDAESSADDEPCAVDEACVDAESCVDDESCVVDEACSDDEACVDEEDSGNSSAAGVSSDASEVVLGVYVVVEVGRLAITMLVMSTATTTPSTNIEKSPRTYFQRELFAGCLLPIRRSHRCARSRAGLCCASPPGAPSCLPFPKSIIPFTSRLRNLTITPRRLRASSDASGWELTYISCAAEIFTWDNARPSARDVC